MPNHFSWMLKKANLSSSSSPPPSFPLWGPRKARKKLLPPTQKSLSPPFPFPPDKHEGSRVGLGWVGLGWQLFSARDIYQRDMLTEEEEGRERERERERESGAINPPTSYAHWRTIGGNLCWRLGSRQRAQGETIQHTNGLSLIQRTLHWSRDCYQILFTFPYFCLSRPSFVSLLPLRLERLEP